ncbi:variant erythrocyte surface antigen-1 family protein [Babesia caballi]|uniref:Variant erythrocyte surface antigen-1 family protein n=1 Tax=Babesia caballi TaxID=5871 RepID=A0AAV4M1Y3_BABCB|nr:variant erythrocyte surface antigen-1 family protein [Babesia caballi]
MSLADCPSNLKEAIDWILRVTGKDGQDQNGGSQGNTAVTEFTKELMILLEEVKVADPKLGQAFEKVKKAFEDGRLIVKLADGLQQFIGYEGGSNTGQITGAGIAPSNIATHRLCDAAIAFTIGVLEGCKKHSNLSTSGNKTHLENVNNAISSLHGKYGKGPGGLKRLASIAGSTLKSVDGSNVGGFVRDIGKAFNNLNGVSDDVSSVALKVGEYLKGVFNQDWSSDNGVGISTKLQALGKALESKDTYDPGKANSAINAVGGALNPKPSIARVKNALNDGKKAFISQLKKKNYESYYKGVTNDNINASTHAKIFLGCLPFIFNNLSYFYWQCRESGTWRNQNLTGGALSPFMQGHWFFNSGMNENMTGTSVVKNVMDKKFEEFKTASSGKHSYSDFLKNFKSTGIETWQQGQQTASTDNYLSGLYILCSCYFQCQQITNAKSAAGAPQTIREMLYFLAALQFSPQYDAFDKYVTEYFKTLTGNKSGNDSDLKLQVADSGITPKPGSSASSDTLSAADVKSYITSTFHLAPAFIGLIQEPSTSSDPWLHRLYFNTHFDLNFPSSPSALFNALSNYAYALQFQLGFLYQQCSQLYVNICGWFMCTFGKDVNTTLTHRVVPSHICSVGCTTGAHNNSDDITKHKTYCEHADCGKSNNKSPLQAFLTDNLKGFSRGHPSDPSSHLASCSGSLCHVPMGFESHLRDGSVQGGNISLTLKPYCGSHNAPLRQLCGTLTCLSKRAPRSLGDLFGFYWQVTGQLSKTLGSLHSAQWFSDLVGHTPFSSTVKDHINVLQTFVGTGHDSHTDSRTDLSSLHLSIQQNHSACYGTGKTCGPYLYPFTVSNGATFGMPAPYASVYLSWIVYLTDDLETGFQELLDEFKYIDCTKTGCRKSTIGQTKCEQSHLPGTHGNSNECKCDSVVHCGGVLPLLYRYGFTFGSVSQLSGNNKRTCEKFDTQLQNVINGEALTKLLTTIDDFIFFFRYYFLSNLSGFWTIYICLILYTFLFLLDTLHVRSHLKFTSSHTVPPLALLTTGKARALTKLTYYLP